MLCSRRHENNYPITSTLSCMLLLLCLQKLPVSIPPNSASTSGPNPVTKLTDSDHTVCKDVGALSVGINKFIFTCNKKWWGGVYGHGHHIPVHTTPFPLTKLFFPLGNWRVCVCALGLGNIPIISNTEVLLVKVL